MADEVTVDVLIELKERGLAEAALLRAELGRLNEQVRDLNQSLERNADRAHQDARALIELAGAATVARGAAGGGGILGFVHALAMIMPGGTVLGFAMVGLIAFTVLFTPLMVAVAGGIVMVTAFTVALATLATTIAIGLGAFIALGAVIAVLADAAYSRAAKAQAEAQAQAAASLRAHTSAVNAHQAALLQLQRAENSVAAARTPSANQLLAVSVAQQKVANTAQQMGAAQYVAGVSTGRLVDPLGALEKHLTAMADQLGFRSVPLLIQMAHWVDTLLPMVQAMGNMLVTWFGQRLPSMLPIMSRVVNILAQAFLDLFSAIGGVVDYIISHPQLMAFFQQLVGFGVSIGIGLLANLLRLSDWFLARLPAIEKIALPILGGIGNVIQGIGFVSGKLVDWFIGNWSKITAVVKTMFDAISAGWNKTMPAQQQILPVIAQLWADVTKHSKELVPLWSVLGGIAGVIALAFENLLVVLLGIAAVFERIVGAVTTMINNFPKIPNVPKWLADLVAHYQLQNAPPVTGPGGQPALGPNIAPPSQYLPGQPATLPPIPGGHGASSRLTVLPVVYSPIPPSREQLIAVREGIRRLNVAQT